MCRDILCREENLLLLRSRAVKMNKFSSLFIAIFIGVSQLYSQITPEEIDDLIKTGSEQLLVKENSRLMQEDFLYYADKIAARLLEFDASSSNYNYRKGYTTLYSLNDPRSAIQYFTVAITNTNKNYDAFSKNEKAAPHDAHFHYAECLHKLGQYDKSIEQLYVFKEKSREESELLEAINLKIQQIQNAKNAAGPNLQIQSLDGLNTEYPDYAPLISLDGKLMFYTSRRPWSGGKTALYNDRKSNFPPEDGYVAHLNNAGWSASEKLEICTPHHNEAGLAMSANERALILYTDSTGNGDLYFGTATSSITQPVSLDQDTSLNTEFWETHATFSADGNTMYFTSDRDGGLGGRDIYYRTKNAEGKWSQPINIGSPVNSGYDEDGPFLSYDGRILYFSSNGLRSYGGFDLFYSQLESDGKWSMPFNMGAPFNSTFDDVFYSTTIDGKTCYLSSNREGGKGSLDIYTVNRSESLSQVAVFKGHIKTSTGEALPEEVVLDMTLKCTDCIVKEQQFSLTPRLRDGIFYGKLEPCKTYHIVLYNPGKPQPFHEETFATECALEYQEIYREFIYDMNEKIIKPIVTEVEPIDTLVADYKNFEFMRYFGYNKNKVSNQDNEIAGILKNIEQQISDGRKQVTINLYSSSSKVPTKTYGTNEKLAQLRAENLKKELETYIKANKTLNGKVSVKIVSVSVDGPEYNKDSGKLEKYRPYQFVGFKTE
jgi:hypothetical protein